DGRIGTFRGRRGKDGKYMGGYGGTAFGTKGTRPIGSFSGYEPLLSEIIKFFKSGVAPMDSQETLEIYAFMEAADESRQQQGKTISLKAVMDDATIQAKELLKTKYDLE
ncbi:MAG TPA: dehydrogenase, partial [Planctomycetaceae bacterium]|nr:dehydrogenase [Planctomycetaceae bacterium]